ncbi:hypothetical protein LA080_004195 [Diaporthe eres]|nr:hypothetical protein LA080_004195 [Diaporthe eres]
MQCKLCPIVALLLLLFTDNVLASFGCYGSGNTWSDMGNDDEVNYALETLCQKLTGNYMLYLKNPQCHDVNGHGIQGSILITDGPHGKLEPHVSQEACMDVIKQVKDKCPHGGSIGRLVSHPDKYGGDWFRANVVLDPNDDGC